MTLSRMSLSARAGAGALAVLLAWALLPAGARALEPPRPGELQRYAADGTLAARLARAKALGNNRLAPGVAGYLRARALLQSSGAAGALLTPPPAWHGMPTTGNVKILTLLIDFNDWPAHNTKATIDSKLFGSGTSALDYPYESLTNYYKRSSYDQLNLSGNVLGWYRPAYDRSTIAQSVAGRDALIKEALQHYDSLGHDFSQYDNNGDGAIDYFIVVWTGPDNGWSNFWWGMYIRSGFSDPSFTLDGKTLGTYSWQWECRYDKTVTPHTTDGVYDQVVVMHETGHALGLPDLYDYDPATGPKGGVGGLDMMDADWGDHNAFSKWMLGWLTPQVITGDSQSVTLAASGTSPQALVVMPAASAADPFAEYFVVQNRQRVGNDSDRVSAPNWDLPGDGLLVWHVDARLDGGGYDFLYDNSYTAHKLLRLMEADGLEEIQTTSGTATWPQGWAEQGDYYVAGKTFGDSTMPNSKRYDGSASNVTVTGIGSPGTSMTFTAGIGAAAVDTTGPQTFAPRRATVQRGKIATLYYRVTDDQAVSCTVTIKVKTLAGRVVRTLRLGLQGCSTLRHAHFRCRLAKKTYRFWVYATDGALNPQSSLGRNTLVVR